MVESAGITVQETGAGHNRRVSEESLGTLVAVETAEGERECRLFAERRRGAQQAPRPAVDPGASRGLSSCSRAFKKPLEAAGSRKTLLWPDRRLINGLLGNGRCDGCTE
ncbi:hypothetical protein A7C99_4428 [Trichophyton rubrum]|uniref:Uncharacterized protein n=1 Tax=Trichophyton rubrum TaxID=5551 RepID=A0A178EWP6_TRIRU|nr:hypothetical protein A7C99_4428 [Trichophyton rubrum]